MSEKTVAAISTPRGMGGISVIRISGDDAIAVAEGCFKAASGKPLSSLKGYEACFGSVFSGNELIDDAVALVFRAPKSYTGENVVEISVHGGTAVAERALRAVFQSGAEPAGNGEFTKRAFLNGKLDLAEAESVMELISAKNNTALRISKAAKDGKISREIEGITDRLLETAASLAAYADYPDEEIEGLNYDNFSFLLNDCKEKLKKMLDTFDASKRLREGIDCAIVGKPNVGKSTLMNMLSGFERSIVTDIAGTTRDVIENTVMLGDLTLNLADTAGIRNTSDAVETVGVELARTRIDTASVILAVFDNSSPLTEDDKQLLSRLESGRTVIVLNKTDLGAKIDNAAFSGFKTVEISAKEQRGLSELQRAIEEITEISSISENDAVLISERQRNCAYKAYNAITEAENTLLAGFTLDAVGICVDDAIAALLELTGKRVANEVCDEVFRRFCVGK